MTTNSTRDNLGIVAALSFLVAFLGFVGIEGSGGQHTLSGVMLAVGGISLGVILVTALVSLVVRAGRATDR